jgi:NADH-ubiquinone oxidoreductase chain 3
LALVLGGAIGVLSKKRNLDINKRRPFECGFSPKKNSRVPFSLQFFLIALVFLIFDIELIILFPVILSTFSNIGLFSYPFTLFIVILIYGLVLEWSQGSLE